MKNLILSLFFFIISFSYFSQKERKIYFYTIEKNDLLKVKNNKLKKSNDFFNFFIDLDKLEFSASGEKLKDNFLGQITYCRSSNDTLTMNLVSSIENGKMQIILVITDNFLTINGVINDKNVSYYTNIFERQTRVFN